METSRRKFDGVFARRLLGGLLVVLAIFTVQQNFVIADRHHTLVECQTEFVEKFTESLKVRTDATEADRAAIDTLVFDITKAGRMKNRAESRAAYSEALKKYAHTRHTADKQRAAHPYPDTTLSEECQR